MPKAIIRTAKLKSAPEIRGCASHNSRTRETPNADRTKKNETLVDGGSDLYETVMNHIKSAGVKRKVRANAVLAQEIFMSASPEFFRPSDPANAGYWDQKRMEAWRDASFQFLQKKYGDHMVDCRLHLDESTPHIHAIVVPILQDKKGAKLTAKKVFSRIALGKLQDEYPKALQESGLYIERGIKGSKATHTKIKDFYNIVNQSNNDLKNVPQVKVPTGTEAIKSLTNTYRTKKIQNINQNLKKKLAPTIQKARMLELERKRRKEYELTAEMLSEKNQELKNKLQLANDKARSVPLDLVLEKAGLDRDVKDKTQWIGAGHRITTKKQKWYDHGHAKGGGGAIDLTKHLLSCDFKQAVAWLGQKIDIDVATRALKDQAAETAKAYVNDIDVTFHAPEPAPDQLPALKKYLADVRGIDPSITDPLIKNGSIYAEKKYQYVNAVFLCRNNEKNTGAEVRGLIPDSRTGKNYKGSAPGTNRKEGSFFVGLENPGKKAVFVESALDALAYKQLHPGQGLIISTAGATTPPPYIIKELIPKGFEIVFAYDNDEHGQIWLKKWQAAVPDLKVEIPHAKDWNEDLLLEQKQNQDMENDFKMQPLMHPF